MEQLIIKPSAALQARYTEKLLEAAQLEEWSKRPSRRKSKAHQRALTTWRYACHSISIVLAMGAITCHGMGDGQTALSLWLLAGMPLAFPNHAPDAWVVAHKVMEGLWR